MLTKNATRYDCKARTPWGCADSATKYAPGIIQYSTPSHGGFHLSKSRLAEMPPALAEQHGRVHYSGELGWFEEDCEWCLVVLSFPNIFADADIQKHAESTLRHWMPEAWEAFYGRTLLPAESNRRDENVFYEANKENWLAVAAWGDWQGGVPDGFVGVCAIKGGRGITPYDPRAAKPEEKYFLIPQAEYDTRKYSFVIDLARHQIVDCFTHLPRKQQPVAA